MRIRFRRFQSLLYYIFIQEKRYRVDEMAEALGISPQYFYDIIEGKGYCPPDLIAKLIKLTHDKDIVDFFLKDAGLVAVPISKAEETKKNLYDAFLRIPREIGDVARVFEKAIQDGILTNQEIQKIDREIYEAIQALEVFRHKIKNFKSLEVVVDATCKRSV